MNDQMNAFAAKVSIIVPVCNTAEYLRECLDSILQQTLTNIEIICVDDGSTDGSIDILYEYAAKDGRLQVICQENQTAGVARNRGMDVATGEYLLFLDSDDFFSPSLAETAYQLAKDNDADMVIFGADNFDDATKKHIKAPWYVREPYLPMEQPFAGRDIADNITQATTSCPWNKLFKRSFIMENQLRFQALPNTNDLCFVLAALMLAERIAWTATPLVSYRRGMTSNTQSKRELAPTAFYEALDGLRNELIARDLYKVYERSFLDFARLTCDFNFKAISLEALSVEKRIEIEESLGVKSSYKNEKKYPCGPIISVCVAVYNTAKYLRTCMDSLIRQTYPNIEIICVNDGSTDNSLEILREYEKRDPRVVIVDKEKNEKLMLARVSALEVATGDYAVFVDSDDYLDVDAMDTIAAAILAHDVDIIQFDCTADVMSDDKSYATWFQKNCQPLAQQMTGPDYLNHTYLTRKIPTFLWGKAYRLSLLRDAYSKIPQEEIYVGEDVYAMFFIAVCAHSYIGVRSKPLYHYRYGLGVGNMNKMSLEKFSLYCGMAHLVDNVQHFLQENHYTCLQRDACQRMGERLLDDVLSILLRKRLEEEDVHQAELMIVKEWHTFPGARAKVEDALGLNMTLTLNEVMDIPVFEKPIRLSPKHRKVPLVSVIIPAFNCEQYLRECVDSVINQKVRNIEIILINDGSYDQTLAIMEEYYLRHNNIAIISRHNGGQSAARNQALKMAQGKYVLFLDSDDMHAANCLTTLTEYAEQNELDFLGFDSDTFYDMDEAESEKYASYDDYYHRQDVYGEPVKGIQLMCAQQKNHDYRVSPCMMLLRREWMFEKDIRFEEGIIFEDNLFTFKCHLYADRCAHIPERLYLRRMRTGSTVTSAVNMNHVKSYLTCYLLMSAELHRVGVVHEEYPECEWIAKSLLNKALSEFNHLVANKKFVPKTTFDRLTYSLLQSLKAAAAAPAKPAAPQAKANASADGYTLSQVPAVPNQTDLNSLNKAGTYLVLHNQQDKVIKNCPTCGTYKLIVDVLTNNVLRQTLIAGNSYNVFVRSYAFGSWTEWKNIAACASEAAASLKRKPRKSLFSLVKRGLRAISSALCHTSF